MTRGFSSRNSRPLGWGPTRPTLSSKRAVPLVRAGAVIVVDNHGHGFTCRDAVSGGRSKDYTRSSRIWRLETTPCAKSQPYTRLPELVAMIDNGTARVIDTGNGRIVSRIPGSDASWVAFSGSFRRVQREDGSLEIWNDLRYGTGTNPPGGTDHLGLPSETRKGTHDSAPADRRFNRTRQSQ